MCSITCYTDNDLPLSELKESFASSISRGPDETKYLQLSKGYFGFHRLAIMDLDERGMQPFVLNNKYLICNGEIYGFRDIKKELENEYHFTSDSDCEVLIPLYEKYGFKMFNKLDAEFALVLYDDVIKEFIAARDPIGIRPLFYGYSKTNKIIFASTPACLLGICEKIYPFPPGHYYYKGQFIEYADVTYVKEYNNDDFNQIMHQINSKLTNGVIKRLDSDAPIGFLLSGGLDSSLVCSIASKHQTKPIETFAIGMSDDAIDLKYAREVAEYLKTNHHEIIITKDDVINCLDKVIYELGTYDITTIRASVGMYLICKFIKENTNIKVLLTGEISDELFGYKYTDFAPNAKAFQDEAVKRISEIHMYDVLRADRCISCNSLEARVPFGDLDFVKYVMSINPEIKLNKYHKGKYLLRKAFENGYLPVDILYREKAAFSDAVGHSMVDYLKEYANNIYQDEEYEALITKYDNPRPFTKESLLYREIFEKYYPSQSSMVKDYWMPNKEWDGCNVSDPSARVLANYGDSGK